MGAAGIPVRPEGCAAAGAAGTGGMAQQLEQDRVTQIAADRQALIDAVFEIGPTTLHLAHRGKRCEGLRALQISIGRRCAFGMSASSQQPRPWRRNAEAKTTLPRKKDGRGTPQWLWSAYPDPMVISLITARQEFMSRASLIPPMLFPSPAAHASLADQGLI